MEHSLWHLGGLVLVVMFLVTQAARGDTKGPGMNGGGTEEQGAETGETKGKGGGRRGARRNPDGRRAAAGGAAEKARIVTAEEGKSITVKCSTTKNAESMHLYQRMESEKKVLYYFRNPPKCTPEDEFVDRVKTEGEMVNLSVTISNVTDDDSGLYWCSYNMIQDLNLKKFNSSFTLVVVNADLKPCPPAEPVPTPPCHLPMTSLRVIITICAGSVVLLNVVILLICLGLKMTKARGKAKSSFNKKFQESRR
ncbi:uncharacterized protein [Paramormyrops kingsleyae]|uniref:uncharacterized protein isoform X2 n=1 Tax=Paramormyrops kingsleyae TaxID=1676925 RepID=UPI003B97B0BB